MVSNIVAPSFGEVIEAKREGDYWHVSTFLAVWDNHDQFIPCDCKCLDSIYKPGQFNLAHMLGKSDKNERWLTVFSADFGPFAVTQISGLVAKRIINHCQIGYKYKQGQVYGEILLGSRVDITFPVKDIQLLAAKGDKLQGGLTVIGVYQPQKKLTFSV